MSRSEGALPPTSTPRAEEQELELSVVVPCLNEEGNVRELCARVLAVFDAAGIAGELVLVDDGSADGTAAALRALAEAHPRRVVPVFHAQNRGIAAAWRSGAERARGEAVAVMDADLQYRPEDLPRLLAPYRAGEADVVQGFRSAVGRERGRRYHLSRGFHALLNGTFGMELRDNKSGFVLCARETFLDLCDHERDYAYFQSFLLVAAHAKGYRIREVETLFEPRRQGRSFLDGQALAVSAKSLLDVARAAAEYRGGVPPADPARRFLQARGVAPGEPRSRAARPAYFAAYMRAFDATHWMITRAVERHLEVLEATQWLSPSDLRELQDEKLRRIVRHAYRSVPFHRRRMQEAGLTPADIRTQADLSKLPLLSKDDVRRNLHRGLVADGFSPARMLRVLTSGSTGEPLVCYADRGQLEQRWAATLRAHEWTGYRLGDPSVRLWHQAIGMTRGQVLRERADALLARRTFVPVFDLREDLAPVVAAVERAAPVLLDGYAEALDLLARFILARGDRGPRVPSILSSAQDLPEESRRAIERAFGGRVFDKYGSREFSGIAYESEARDGHLVVGESYVVELLVEGRPARPGEVGEVVVTDLNNLCMPFLRYRLGDLAEAVEDRPSRCGRGLPRIGAIWGRVQSIIVGTEGRIVPGAFFGHALKDFDHAFARFLVEQDRPGEITLRVVPAARFSREALAEAEALIRAHLGRGLRIQTEVASSLPLGVTGKRIGALSRLHLDVQEGRVRFTPGSWVGSA